MTESPQSPQIGELSYQSPSADRMTTLRQATWITLLVVGILTLLLGTCIGTAADAGIISSYNRRAGIRTPTLFLRTYTWTAAVLLVAGPLVVGVGQIICAFKIRKFSVRATIVAAVLSGILMAGLLCILALAILGIVRARMPPDPSRYVGMITLALPLPVLVILEFMFFRLLGERRRLTSLAD